MIQDEVMVKVICLQRVLWYKYKLFISLPLGARMKTSKTKKLHLLSAVYNKGGSHDEKSIE